MVRNPLEGSHDASHELYSVRIHCCYSTYGDVNLTVCCVQQLLCRVQSQQYSYNNRLVVLCVATSTREHRKSLCCGHIIHPLFYSHLTSPYTRDIQRIQILYVLVSFYKRGKIILCHNISTVVRAVFISAAECSTTVIAGSGVILG